MTKRRFELTEQERAQLFQAYELCKDGPTRTRYQAVKLYGEGYLEKDIELITGCSRASTRWHKKWISYAFSALPWLVHLNGFAIVRL
jgi:hypothetical protein